MTLKYKQTHKTVSLSMKGSGYHMSAKIVASIPKSPGTFS